jgi:creatinine amidohydrolase
VLFGIVEKHGPTGPQGTDLIPNVMPSRPGLAHPERSSTESGTDQKRLDLPEGVYTGISWYARFPNHYAGDSAGATAARGDAAVKAAAARIASAIRAIKKEFFERAAKPTDTKQ